MEVAMVAAPEPTWTDTALGESTCGSLRTLMVTSCPPVLYTTDGTTVTIFGSLSSTYSKEKVALFQGASVGFTDTVTAPGFPSGTVRVNMVVSESERMSRAAETGFAPNMMYSCCVFDTMAKFDSCTVSATPPDNPLRAGPACVETIVTAAAVSGHLMYVKVKDNFLELLP